MCGFAGFVGSVDDREQVLVNMMNTIIHRGPDSEGKYVDEDAALGFRRLSIIDLSSVGDQPLYNEDKSMVLVFNGEIYNYQELKKELQDVGHTFVSNTDSETLIHGYEEWGESLVERLRLPGIGDLQTLAEIRERRRHMKEGYGLLRPKKTVV